MIVQGESRVSSLLEYTAEPQPILCKDNALCHNSNFLSPQIFITATYRTISTRFVSLKVVKFKQKPA